MTDRQECFGQSQGLFEDCVAEERRFSLGRDLACKICVCAKFDALEAEANTDPLTGLKNQRGLNKEFHRLSQAGLPFGIIYIDLTNFKYVNEVFGHRAGDDALKLTSDFLAAKAREQDSVVARQGGDEFVVLANLEPRPRASRPTPLTGHYQPPQRRLEAMSRRLTEEYNQLEPIYLYNQQVSLDKQLGFQINSAVYDYETETPMSLQDLLNAADPKGEMGYVFEAEAITASDRVLSLLRSSSDFVRSIFPQKT